MDIQKNTKPMKCLADDTKISKYICNKIWDASVCGVAISQLALHWMCNSPWTVCAKNNTHIYVAQTSN